jgi:hypothetical protein
MSPNLNPATTAQSLKCLVKCCLPGEASTSLFFLPSLYPFTCSSAFCRHSRAPGKAKAHTAATATATATTTAAAAASANSAASTALPIPSIESTPPLDPPVSQGPPGNAPFLPSPLPSSQAGSELRDTRAFQAPQSQDTQSTLFFGESNILTCVVGPAERQGQAASPLTALNRMSYPITEAITDGSPQLSAPTSTNSTRANHLLNEGAFTFAEPNICLVVLQAYFEWFHPCFPILDRAEIYKQHSLCQLSPLLLQAVLFIGASYCDDDTVHSMGFNDRPDAKHHLYHRARALYDLDWENNKITILQSLFLISFWRGGPLNEKNTRYWLGAAISLAQTRGFHRS